LWILLIRSALGLEPKVKAALGARFHHLRDSLHEKRLPDISGPFSLDPKDTFGISTRVTRGACDNGKGNYGINSFNFMAFVLLTFNVVANVNNNLNNNNNNKNDNNINAISQNSNNVATNTNVGNSIGVTVLPIPGKRSLDILTRDLRTLLSDKGCIKGQTLSDTVASELFSRLVELNEILDKKSSSCIAFKLCKAIKSVVMDYVLDDAVAMGLASKGEVPFMRFVRCESLFPTCAFAR
jgi:hypothetical protein